MNEYPPEWPDVAAAVKEAAGWRCVRCGHPDYPANLPRGKFIWCDGECTHEEDRKQRVLTVHHLDGDKANIKWWNLPALCQACHLSIQARVHLDQAWMWSHSEWFEPYVAGYYASLIGEDLSREEVEERLIELLIAGTSDEYAGRVSPLERGRR